MPTRSIARCAAACATCCAAIRRCTWSEGGAAKRQRALRRLLPAFIDGPQGPWSSIFRWLLEPNYFMPHFCGNVMPHLCGLVVVRRPVRQLLSHERPLVEFLFELAGLNVDLDTLLVEPMSDGSMGSLSLGPDRASRKFGRQVAECHFVDDDQVLVSVTLNVDSNGLPFEVDVWKVSFGATVRWPLHNEIVRGPPNKSLERTRGR
jgi:hypothetical protein